MSRLDKVILFFRDIQGYPQIMRLQSKSKVQFLICCFDFDAMVSLRKKQCYCMKIDFSKCAQYIINRVSLITCRRSGGFITGPLFQISFLIVLIC